MPTETRRFVGRNRELDEINDLLERGEDRLISLTGPGGIGKTSLAAEAMRRFRKNNSGVVVYWVRLARVPPGSDKAAVERETTGAVVEADFSERSGFQALIDTLSGIQATRTILVFDNCEHVNNSVVHLINDLIETVPALTVLATTRTALGWRDEMVKHVPPLARDQALTLFRQRVQLTGHQIAGDEDEVLAAEICKHLNYHPLDIRLAAARRRLQSLRGIRNELTGRADDDQRMHWPSGHRAGVDERHMKVTDVIQWSYDLCSARERLLFDRLSVFAAGYDTNPEDDDGTAVADVGADLAAIQAVCGDDDNSDSDPDTILPRGEVQRLLEGLVDHSMVTIHITTSTVRYSLLETLRMFAWRQLGTRSTPHDDQIGCLTRQHLQYYRDRVTAAAADCFGPAEQELLDWARASWDNILTAIDTSLASPQQAQAGLEICIALIKLRIPFLRGSMRDIRRWTERCLDATDSLEPRPAALQLEARSALTWLAVRQGQSEEANRMLDACVSTYLRGAHTDWRQHPETDYHLPPQIEIAWGTEGFMDNRDPRAIRVLVRARDKFREQGDHGGEMMAGMFAGFAAGLLGTSQEAHDISEQCYELAVHADAPSATSWAALSRAVALTKHGNPDEALDILQRALRHQMSVRDQWGAAWAVELRTWALAALLPDDRRHDTARTRAIATEIAHLSGGISTVRGRLGINIASMGTFADESQRAIRAARGVLGKTAFTTAQQRGEKLRPEDNAVHRIALGELDLDAAAPTPAPSPWHTLTAAELEIAILVAAGYKNIDIAALRGGKSRRTIDAQVASIFSKLSIQQRREINKDIPDAIRTKVDAAVEQRLDLDPPTDTTASP